MLTFFFVLLSLFFSLISLPVWCPQVHMLGLQLQSHISFAYIMETNTSAGQVINNSVQWDNRER